MKLFRKDVIANNPVLYFLVGFVVVACVFAVMVHRQGLQTTDLIVEVFGFLLDIMLFGILLSLYDRWRERRTKIRNYHEQLTDFLSWEGQEGVLRKVGIIKRLNEMRATLPNMIGIVLTDAKLSKADFGGADLRLANLEGADLSFTILERTNLTHAVLTGADLMGANLKSANLQQASLEEADLNGANLKGADLRHAILKGARLWEANLEGADLSYAVIENADLYSAIGLTREQLKHAKGVNSASRPDYLQQEDEEKGENEDRD